MADTKLMEWYQGIVELGNFEVEHTRIRFYENAKVHLTLIFGAFAITAFGFSRLDWMILCLPILVFLFGIWTSWTWARQLSATAHWESRWRQSASEIEQTSQFRALVEGVDVKVWSHDEVKPRLVPDARKTGATAKMCRSFVVSLIAFYAIAALGVGIAARRFSVAEAAAGTAGAQATESVTTAAPNIL